MENRRDLFKLAALSAAAGLSLNAREGGVPNAVQTPAHAALTQKPFGDERIYFNGSTTQLKGLTAGSLLLHPGQEPHPPHQHPEEEIMLVTEGQGEILVAGVKHKVSAGAMMYCEGNQLHGVKNTSDAPLVFYFYKWQA
jgi:oxalate decarboxylase/phosphoglucose isomerase-like protein (cupin superfamily)